MDTVQLNGKHFVARVKQGEKIKKGQTLIEFDNEAIKKEGYSTVTPVLITNVDKYLDIIETDSKQVNKADDILTAIA